MSAAVEFEDSVGSPMGDARQLRRDGYPMERIAVLTGIPVAELRNEGARKQNGDAPRPTATTCAVGPHPYTAASRDESLRSYCPDHQREDVTCPVCGLERSRPRSLPGRASSPTLICVPCRVKDTDRTALGAILDLPNFTEAALCAEVDPEIWFPETKGSSANIAKKMCGRCDARRECLAYALRTGQQIGVWGGITNRPLRQARVLIGLDGVSTDSDEFFSPGSITDPGRAARTLVALGAPVGRTAARVGLTPRATREALDGPQPDRDEILDLVEREFGTAA